ncbi:kinase-like domain-containing protein [Pisolithus albus]|nr:kinase-like domain-containing protein [Pisolithus albus]
MFENFEHISMELVGPSAAQLHKDGAGTTPKTVIRIVDQAVSLNLNPTRVTLSKFLSSVLEHIHSLGIVHGDIKPDNFLCTLDDPSRIKLIDFGISKPFACDKSTAPKEYDPLKERQHIIGTLYCASLNSHGEGRCSNVGPWKLALETSTTHGVPTTFTGDRPSRETPRSGPDLSAGFPKGFDELLT